MCKEGFVHVLCRPGGDLLSHVLRQSTIGAGAFDGRVRDGIGSGRSAEATRPAKHVKKQNWFGPAWRVCAALAGGVFLSLCCCVMDID